MTCQSQYWYCAYDSELDIEDYESDAIIIYPNPGSDIINISSRIDINIEVYDMLGNLLLTKENPNNIDISKLSAGIYIFTILYDNVRINKKVVKQ